jgi:phospholipase/carboxylesterase/glyoxalase family protein
MVAVGFSNGANIAGSLLLLHPDALDGAILFRAMVPFVPDNPPPLEGKPIYLGAGRADPIVHTTETERWAAMLRAAGAEITLHWSEMGHSLSQEDVDAAREWLRARFR